MKSKLCALVVGLVIVVSSAQAATYNLPANGTITLQGAISAPFAPISIYFEPVIPNSPGAYWFGGVQFRASGNGTFGPSYYAPTSGCSFDCAGGIPPSFGGNIGLLMDDQLRTLTWMTGISGFGATAIPHIALTLPDGVTFAQTPLPAAAWLFLTALAGLGLFKRRSAA
jgi:hypothetical protein